MEETKVGKETYTHKEVEEIVTQVHKQARAQCENLANRCRHLEEQIMFKRLDYLFKVVDNKEVFSSEFIRKCVEEIEGALSIPENTEEDK